MRLRALAVSALLLFGAPSMGRAQAGSCNIVDLPEFNEQVQRDPASATIFIQGPFLVRCAGGAELRADQGTLYEATSEMLVVGNVDYRDPTRSLTAQQATYTSTIGRLYATGDVVFADQVEGMTIRGPELEYFRAMEGRPEAQVNAGQRPHMTLRPKGEGQDTAAAPMEVDADRMTIIGKNNLSATGDVVIERTDLHATAEEATYDGETEGLELRQNATILSKEDTLRGEVIQAKLAEGALQHVRARTRASIVGANLNVTAPDLQLFFEDELLQRAVARRDEQAGPGERAVALSRTFRIEADSIDALAPGQRVDQVIAIGNARGESIDTTAATASAPAAPDSGAAATPAAPAAPADTTGKATPPVPELMRNDWITGDTIISYFAPGDSTAGEGGDPGTPEQRDTSVVLKRIVAKGSARSLYRVQEEADTTATTAQPSDSSPRRGINFLSGEVITLQFEKGELDLAEVTGLRRGLYLDPVPKKPEAKEEATPQTSPAAPTPRGGTG